MPSVYQSWIDQAPSMYHSDARAGVYGQRELLAQLGGGYPQSLDDINYTGHMHEDRIMAEIGLLRQILDTVNPTIQPLKAHIINQEMQQKQQRLQSMQESRMTSSRSPGIDVEREVSQGLDALNRAAQWTPYGSTTQSSADLYGTTTTSSAGPGAYRVPEGGVWTTTSASSGTQAPYVAERRAPQVAQGYTPPSWMQGWLSPMGLRPLGAQTAVTPTQKMALWEQKAAEAYGRPITSLSDYERHVEPFRQLWGETHEAGSQRLTPKARGRSSSWLAARQ